MREYMPLLIMGGIIGLFAVLFVLLWCVVRRRKDELSADRHMSDREILTRLGRYARPYWGQFLLALAVMLLSVAYSLVSPLLVGRIEELIKDDFPLERLWSLVAVYAGLLAVSMVCTYGQSMILQKVGQKILSSLRQDLFTHIESLSHDQLNAIPVGKLVTRVTNDTNAISLMFTNILANMARNVFILFGVLGAMLLVNYALTLMVLCFVPFLVMFTVIFRKLTRRAYRRVKDCTTDINTYLSENLSGIKITQVFNREDAKMRDFLEKSRALQRARQRQMLVFGVFRPMVYMLYISSVLCLFYVGSRGYIRDTTFLGQTVTSGTVVTFYLYISKFFDPIQMLAEQFNMLQSAFASAEKIFAVFDMAPALIDEPDAVDVDHIEGDIEFRDVWFAYEPGQWVLKGVSFHVYPRQTVALAGATGSGKSTILALLCRNYDIQRGQILIDGVDIRHIRIASLRKHFGQMLQDVFLFSGTIRSNITLREESFTDQEIWQACRYVNADRFIRKLEGGLDEAVLERGNNFSAGQRQLISFARTVLHRPEVMILDEATANIDTETETLIQQSLERMKNIGTMLVVAHRLSTIQHADNIILLSHGQILEQGTHRELLRRKGMYHKLYTLQFEDRDWPGEIDSGGADML